MRPTVPRRAFGYPLISSLLVGLCGTALGHAVGPLGAQPLDWSNGQISQVVAGGTPFYSPSHTEIIEGRECIVGNFLHFNVRDDFAFDIDESVNLEVEFWLQTPRAMRIFVSYDKNGTTYDANGFSASERHHRVGPFHRCAETACSAIRN